ncbi:F-box/SPRY domain-containing protein 1-like [Babylonia areolata]|uniref:F-box/SPRY domain-containing protein 1-like n=1 Tax=Babylonia areolata TaxID=304850 RepID=UPI003FD68770
MGVTTSTSQTGMTEMEPGWVKTVQVLPEFANDKMGSVSEGFSITNPNSIYRHRLGHFDSDGAKWGRGFTSGKHAFEVFYPVALRGAEATVGVGTESAPLYAKGKVALVGSTKDSWGISLRTKRSFHRNAMVKKYPITQRELPDKFYMYLDVDAGLLQFGSDVGFYGTALNHIPRNQPLHPMVSSTAHKATISIVYRGTACDIAQQAGMVTGPLGHNQHVVIVAPPGGTTVVSTATALPPTPQPVALYPAVPPPPPAYSPQDPSVEPGSGSKAGWEPKGEKPSGGEPSGGEPSGGEPSGGEPSGGEPSGGEPSGEPSGGETSGEPQAEKQ